MNRKYMYIAGVGIESIGSTSLHAHGAYMYKMIRSIMK